jgi:hypothetical protein
MRAALQLWLSFSLLAALLGWLEAPGAAGARALQGWWLSRQFEAAALRDDSDRLARLGESILRQNGSTEPLLFAVHRVAYQSTGPSYHLSRAEAAARVDAGVELLERYLGRLDDPWSGRRIQADIIVNRDGLGRLRPVGEQAAREWFASGGGPHWPFQHPGEVYRAALTLPPAERAEFLLAGLRVGFGEDGEE